MSLNFKYELMIKYNNHYMFDVKDHCTAIDNKTMTQNMTSATKNHFYFFQSGPPLSIF